MHVELLRAGLPLLLKASITILIIWIVKGAGNLIRTRRRFLKMQSDGFPMPPYHPVFGHLLIAFEIKQSLPSNAHMMYMGMKLRHMFPEMERMFYFDTSPFGQPILFINTPDASRQINQDHALPKSDFIRYYMDPFTGCRDLATLEGDDWKRWRSIFNPGFSPNHLLTLVPLMVEQVNVFVDILKEHAEKKDLILLDKFTIKLAIDVIGRAALNENLNTQKAPHEMITALRAQIETLRVPDEKELLYRFNPYRAYVRWRNESIMKKWFADKLRTQAMTLAGEKSKTRKRSIIDLALAQYIQEFPGAIDLDETFEDYASSQLKIFVFAGHDTTSSVICYAYYFLDKYPQVRKKMCDEHDQVLGTDTGAAASILSENPSLLNSLPYTFAVLKEVLRLFPPASAFRQNDGRVAITDPDGRVFPSEGCMLWTVHHAMHRDPMYWPKPDEFIPERWLVAPEDPLYPVKDAYRPFELGPRSCVGQTLATLALRIIMVLTARILKVKPAYNEFDRLHPKKAINQVEGERAYHIQVGSSAPADHFPARIDLV